MNKQKLNRVIKEMEKRQPTNNPQTKINNVIEYLKRDWPSIYPPLLSVSLLNKKTANVYYSIKRWPHYTRIQYNEIEDIYEQILSRNLFEFAKPIRPIKATPEKTKKRLKETFGVDPTD